MKIFNRTLLAALAAVVGAAGCTLDSPEPPAPTGPSTFGLSISVTASPDILPEDGVSQSVIRIRARDANGQPLANVPLRVDTMVGSTIVDFGMLSARNVTTNASGEAIVTFTAPRAPQVGIDTGTIVRIAVNQVGSDFGGSFTSDVRIRLVPESTALIPGAPTPSFFFAPSAPRVAEQVVFNGTSSSDADGTIVRYHWTFSDGHTDNDQAIVDHQFDAAGTYFVTLTVTDNQGKSASVTKAVTVSSGS